MKFFTIIIFCMLYQVCYATGNDRCSDNNYVTNNITNNYVTNNITNINITNIIGSACSNITDVVNTNYTKLITDISSQNDMTIAAIIISCISIFLSILIFCIVCAVTGWLSYKEAKKCNQQSNQ